jgi:hypothetical protein
MTRIEALEAVAEAVRDYWLKSASHENFYAVGQALRALDALPAAPTQGETVEVAMWSTEVEYRFGPLTTQSSRVLVGAGYSLLGTTLLPIRATEGGGE